MQEPCSLTCINHLEFNIISWSCDSCFKVEHSQIKTGKMYFIADNQNDLDLWLKILKTASKGEPIIKPSPSNVVRLDVGHDQRRRSGSTGMRPKHSGSVLGKRC